MDAIEFLKERKRLCGSYMGCVGCPFGAADCVVRDMTSEDNCERIVTAVEQWSKDHTRKTRQSVFLEKWPNAITNNGVIDILPCSIDQSLAECNGADCSKCKCEFWMKEVE